MLNNNILLYIVNNELLEMKDLVSFLLLFTTVLLSFPSSLVVALRIHGNFNTSNFFHFVTKFGFQKTDVRTSERGFIFGNISSLHPHGKQKVLVTLAVLDRGYFLEYYGNKSLANKSRACETMFKKINSVSYDSSCNQDGVEDFLRSIPCTKDGLCLEEDRPENVVDGYQFTYRIQDYLQSRFWYVSIVACARNKTTCKWEPVIDDVELSYDMWLVNGNPENANKNLLRYQFSCDKQDLLGLYLLLLFVFLFLSPIQFYAAIHQNHNITKFLAVGIFIELLGLMGISIHQSLFAINGVGFPLLGNLGDILQILSQSIFTLIILLLGMGWAITRQEITCKFILSTLWILYTLIHVYLYFWKKYEIDIIQNIDEYQTIPGVIIIILRIGAMIYFLYALKDTMLHEFNEERLQFLLHFGAASLVWFIYLPIVAFVAFQISALWRNKFLMGISYSVNTFAYIILVHSLWPSRSHQYFLLALQVSII
uniref:Transmembrane protein 145like [Nasonia vitripennis] n=1 Tax=Lepeophtheirus salmonis TaxID=72036 RepID=A0A0K2V630_LEPSM